MSLQRSVEAGTSTEALELALAKYGANAEVIDVRTFRTGGLLGFFTAERVEVVVGVDAEDTATDVAYAVSDVTTDPVDEVAALFGNDPVAEVPDAAADRWPR